MKEGQSAAHDDYMRQNLILDHSADNKDVASTEETNYGLVLNSEIDDKYQTIPEPPVAEEKTNLSMVPAFLLANLLQIVYMIVQAITKHVLMTQDSMSAYELSFFRSIFNLMASSLYLKLAGDSLRDNIDHTNWKILLIRCISGSICFLFFVVCVEYLPLAIFFVIYNAVPFFVALMACLWLKEVITIVEVAAMVGAFSGILMVGFSKMGAASE